LKTDKKVGYLRNVRRDKKSAKKSPVRKAFAGVVLTAGIMLGCSPEYNVNLIPYGQDSGTNPDNCLQDNERVIVEVEACGMVSEPSVREGDILVIGTAGIEASIIVDVGTTKGLRVNGLDENAGCEVVDTQDILPGETRVITVDGEQHQVELVSLEYDSVGAKLAVTVTPDCYEPLEE
jgi:hypothetical protein